MGLSVVLILLLSALTGPAWSADGRINTLSFKSLPPNPSIAIKAWDNSDENKEYSARIEAYLKSRGYTISSDADLILSFETKDIKGIWTEGDRGHVLEVEGRGGRHGGEQAKVRLSLYSSQEGGLLNQPTDPDRQKDEKIMPQIALDITVDQNKGRRLWQGQVSADQLSGDNRTLVYKLIPILLDKIGVTVRRKSFNFQ